MNVIGIDAKTDKNDKISKLNELIEFCNFRELFLMKKRNIFNAFFLKNLSYYRNVKMIIGDLCAKYNHKGEKFKC